MHIVLALVSALSHSMGNVSLRTYQTKLQRTTADLRLFQCLYILLAAVCYFLLGGCVIRLDGTGLWLALAYGVDLAACFMASAACYLCGPMSLTSIITNACVVMPIVVGCVWYDERMSAARIVGCVLLALTFILSGIKPGKQENRIAPRWYPMVLLAFFLNGMGAVLLNIYGRAAASQARNSFLSLGYALAAVILFAVYLSYPKQEKPRGRQLLRPLFFALVVLSAMGSFVGNGILMRLNTALPATLLYPLVNGGIGVFVAIASCAVFRERLTLLRLVTILTGLSAIVVLNL